MEDENETNEPVTKRHRAMQIIYYLLWICGGSYVGELQELDTLGKSLNAVIGAGFGYISARYWTPY